MDDIDELSRSELIALAGLLRAVIRIDGRFSEAERDALAQVAQMVAEEREGARRGGDTYRESNPLEPIGEDRLFAILEEAGTTLADDAAIRAAALAVTRPEARSAIHAAVTFVANVDVAARRELALLDWLAREWDLPH